MEEVVLVDEQDNQTGTLEKLEAHRIGLLHRAFSVLIFNSKGQILLQQRAANKYHSANLWTNTCCSHPKPGEELQAAAERRLIEEMGVNCSLKWCFSFQYKVHFENGLIENELDHVFIGNSDEQPNFNHDEVREWKYLDLDMLNFDMSKNPNQYTHWFHLIMDKLPLYQELRK